MRLYKHGMRCVKLKSYGVVFRHSGWSHCSAGEHLDFIMLLNNIKLHDLVQAFQDRHHSCFSPLFGLHNAVCRGMW